MILTYQVTNYKLIKTVTILYIVHNNNNNNSPYLGLRQVSRRSVVCQRWLQTKCQNLLEQPLAQKHKLLWMLKHPKRVGVHKGGVKMRHAAVGQFMP